MKSLRRNKSKHKEAVEESEKQPKKAKSKKALKNTEAAVELGKPEKITQTDSKLVAEHLGEMVKMDKSQQVDVLKTTHDSSTDPEEIPRNVSQQRLKDAATSYTVISPRNIKRVDSYTVGNDTRETKETLEFYKNRLVDCKNQTGNAPGGTTIVNNSNVEEHPNPKETNYVVFKIYLHTSEGSISNMSEISHDKNSGESPGEDVKGEPSSGSSNGDLSESCGSTNGDVFCSDPNTPS